VTAWGKGRGLQGGDKRTVYEPRAGFFRVISRGDLESPYSRKCSGIIFKFLSSGNISIMY